jgi:SAM-dependent methyltransferase
MLRGGKAERFFAQCLWETLRDSKDILDIGTSMRFAKELRRYEPLFAGKNYVAAGYRPAMTNGPYNCDCHQDIQEMTFAENSFDAALCLQVLEHVADPFRAARELHRVLRPVGKLLLTVPFLAQYHGRKAAGHSPDHESYPDFWRFTHQGLEELFSAFRNVRVFALDGPVEFRLKQFYLEPAIAWPPLRAVVDWIDRPRAGKATTRHLVMAVK